MSLQVEDNYIGMEGELFKEPLVVEDNSLTEYQKQLPYRVEVLIKALGTMVLVPEYELDQETFKNRCVGSIQRPILENENREQTLKVLSELIEQL